MVEFDLPWDDNAVEEYGDSFKSWSADDFALAVSNTKIALPYANLVFVVFFIPFIHRFRCIIAMHKEISCIKN